ncbi:MAG: O-antigen ligase family protein [Vicinamibacteria bacterium]|jgi:O-antigen ligase|nr:O-antigen ligase family protein [Vicinamibacteria bacterium]
MEAALLASVLFSTLAFGAVHPWAYQTLWAICGLLLLGGMAHAGLVWRLRRQLGRNCITLHPSRQWAQVEPRPTAAHGDQWMLDLRQPILRTTPLLLPGSIFLIWTALQVIPLPIGGMQMGFPLDGWSSVWRVLSFSPRDSLRGMAFVCSGLILHQSAALALAETAALRRFQQACCSFGLALVALALLQIATQTQRIYGFFQPLEAGAPIFGPFVNRNHFAGYMLIMIPLCCDLVQRAYRRYHSRVGHSPNLRRRLTALGTREGSALLYAVTPAIATMAGLLLTTSRGAFLAFVAGLLLTGWIAFIERRRRKTLAWMLVTLSALSIIAVFGYDRLADRFEHLFEESARRTLIWNETIAHLPGHLITGWGLNTFTPVVSRRPPWTLPEGATPWPAPLEAAARERERVAIRSLVGQAGLSWYSEAHNDYLQLLLETGLPGLLLGLWAAVRILRAHLRRPWFFTALCAVLLHCLVDFDLQIPALAALFAILASVGARRSAAHPKT